jgi:hypothetical protein
MVKVDEQRSNITIGAFVTKKIKFMKFRIRRRAQTKSKKWGNVELDFTVDYCGFAKGADNPVVNMFVPGVRQVLGDALRPCPYQGVFLINYTLEPSKITASRWMGQLIKLEIMLVTINSQIFFKLTMLSKVQ